LKGNEMPALTRDLSINKHGDLLYMRFSLHTRTKQAILATWGRYGGSAMGDGGHREVVASEKAALSILARSDQEVKDMYEATMNASVTRVMQVWQELGIHL
jgi:hypothetical protein